MSTNGVGPPFQFIEHNPIHSSFSTVNILCATVFITDDKFGRRIRRAYKTYEQNNWVNSLQSLLSSIVNQKCMEFLNPHDMNGVYGTLNKSNEFHGQIYVPRIPGKMRKTSLWIITGMEISVLPRCIQENFHWKIKLFSHYFFGFVLYSTMFCLFLGRVEITSK